MKKTLSLYELNSILHDTISIAIPDKYWVKAEISELRVVRGNCYIDLIEKDNLSNTPIARASAKCWKSTWCELSYKFQHITNTSLHTGIKVLLKVHADFHPAYGFSWIITDIDPLYSLGEMAQKRKEIVDSLKKQGVFNLQKELSIPLFTQNIAVISSKNAAGYEDFCKQLKHNNHNYFFDITLFSAIMQGEKVEQSIINALNKINKECDKFDVVVIIRGGEQQATLLDSTPYYLLKILQIFHCLS